MATFDLTTGQGTGQIGTATGLSKMVMVEKVFDVKNFKTTAILLLMATSFNL